MGLDQYGTFINKDGQKQEDKDFYWRKHPNLQGFMENLYRSKGGNAEYFNCEDVELTLEDLDRLEKAVEGAELPETQGFFFGGPSDDYYKDQDLDFINQAREVINEGGRVIYSSWW